MATATFNLDMGDVNLIDKDILWNNDDLDDILVTINPDDIQQQVATLYDNYQNTSETNDTDQMEFSNDNIQEEPPRKKLQQSEDKLRSYVQENRNKNTTQKTTRETERFKNYILEQGELRQMHEMPPQDLNVYLGSFLKDLRQKNGKPYEPDSISSFFRYRFCLQK